MRKTIAIVLSLVLMLAFTTVAVAGKAATKQVTGEVSAIDAKAKTITVSKKVKDKMEDTVISADDKMLSGISQGDKVTVKFTAAEGKNTAKSVKKHEAKADKKAPPAAKESAPAEKAPAKKASGY